MKIINRISSIFDRISHDIRLTNIKPSLILASITLFLGIFSWIAGGRPDKVTLLYIFPRCAISLTIMYLLWAVYFICIGFTIGGITFGCEKFKKREAVKSTTLLIISFMCTLSVYALFFICLSPLITFLVLLVSAFFTFLALMTCAKIYSLWTICIVIHLIWILYNSYIAIIITLIN